MDSIIKSNDGERHSSIIEMPFSNPNWLLKVLPWIDFQFSFDKVKIAQKKRKRPELPVDIDIIKESDAFFLSDLLKYVPLFKNLPDDFLKMVLKGIYQKKVNPGDVIVKQGEIGNSFFIILNGQYNVINNTADGNEVILKTLTGGDYFGEMSLLQSMPRQATIKAKEKGNLIVLNRETFLKIIENSQLKDYLELILKQRKAELSQTINEESSLNDRPISNLLTNFIEDPITESLQMVQTSVFIDDLPEEFTTGKSKVRFLLEIEKLTNQVEWEILNNKEYGLLNKVHPDMIPGSKKNSEILDNLDELLSLVWNKPSYFLVHPRTLTAIGRACTKYGLIPESRIILGANFITWRGIPIIPCESVPLYNDNENLTTDILLIRVGVEDRGVIGLHNNSVFNPFNIPSLSVKAKASGNSGAITEYLVTKYFSIKILSPSAVAILKQINI